jgi:hypothetical protein
MIEATSMSTYTDAHRNRDSRMDDVELETVVGN